MRKVLSMRLGATETLRNVTAQSVIVWLGFSEENKGPEAWQKASELVQLVQVLARVRVGRLVVVTRGGVRTGREGEGGRVDASQAGVWGVGRVMRVEQPELRCVNVDVEKVEEVKGEVEEWDVEEAYESAYRGGVRYVPEMVEVKGAGSGGEWNKEAVGGLRYVMSGGFGALARGCVEWMVRHEASRVVMVGRSGADGRHKDMLRDRSEWFREGMWCVRGDTTRLGEVKGVVAAGGEVGGVFHLAGEGMAALLGKTSWGMMKQSFGPKVESMRNMEKVGVLEKARVSVMFSSQATMVPVHGQGAYAAANFAMEAFASSTSVIVCWGAFADVGMYLQMSKKQMEA